MVLKHFSSFKKPLTYDILIYEIPLKSEGMRNHLALIASNGLPQLLKYPLKLASVVNINCEEIAIKNPCRNKTKGLQFHIVKEFIVDNKLSKLGVQAVLSPLTEV